MLVGDMTAMQKKTLLACCLNDRRHSLVLFGPLQLDTKEMNKTLSMVDTMTSFTGRIVVNLNLSPCFF